MNAIELAEECQDGYPLAPDAIAAAKMLRRQHEAIMKLREALERSVAYAEFLERTTYRHPDASQIKSKQALKDTEDLK